MAIGTIISVAAAASTAATGFVFKYTKQEYVSRLSEVERLLAQLGDHLNDLKELREEIPKFWDDENAREVCIELEMTINQTESEMDTVKAYIRTLQTVIEEMSKSGTVMSETIADVKNMLLSGING